MRKTRAEIITELRCRCGQSENTEHLIDWVYDLWTTRDVLLRRFGSQDTMVIVEALACCSSNVMKHELVVFKTSAEELRSTSLN